jgi:hypothetical protein
MSMDENSNINKHSRNLATGNQHFLEEALDGIHNFQFVPRLGSYF